MKKLKWFTVALIALVAGGGVTAYSLAHSWIERNLNREAIVLQLEHEWNCRVELTSVKVDLFASPAMISLKGLAFYLRDAEAGKPLASREPVTGGSLLSIREAWLHLDSGALLRTRLHVRECILDNVYVREEISQDGASMLQTIFAKPKPDLITKELARLNQVQVPFPQPPATDEATPAPPLPRGITEPTVVPALPTASSPSIKVKSVSLPLGIEVTKFKLSNVTFHAINRRAKTRTDLTDLSLQITDVDINTNDLAHHNQCMTVLDCKIVAYNRIKVGVVFQEVKMAEFALNTGGLIHPLSPVTGAFAPDATLSVVLKKGSIFGGALTFGQAFGKNKDLSSLKDKLGLDITDLPVGGALQEDLSTELRLHDGRAEFTRDARLAFTDYAVALRAGSWINGTEDMHEAHIRILPGDDLANRIKTACDAKIGPSFTGIVMGIINDGEGHMALDFKSSERLSKPKFERDGQLGALETLIKQLSGSLFKGLLGQ